MPVLRSFRLIFKQLIFLVLTAFSTSIFSDDFKLVCKADRMFSSMADNTLYDERTIVVMKKGDKILYREVLFNGQPSNKAIDMMPIIKQKKDFMIASTATLGNVGILLVDLKTKEITRSRHEVKSSGALRQNFVKSLYAKCYKDDD
ncbi:MAG: hypothetical protein CBC42_01555 [Betaproteobacteria bacterium TMED82]|nr:MAG: hypothetical protein CBC42_01555 [Betaproteobacteria bacterium TMED82]|tara:strand:+ start:44424 stop:44861 length:438 start_codon:yes stop_codon:yes gene_type:complete